MLRVCCCCYSINYICDWLRQRAKVMSEAPTANNRAHANRWNTYSNTSSFFFLTILILHHKSAYNQKKQEIVKVKWKRTRLIPNFWWNKWFSNIPRPNRSWRSWWRCFSFHCSGWCRFATVAEVTHTYTHREAFPLWQCPIHMLLLWIAVIVGLQRLHIQAIVSFTCCLISLYREVTLVQHVHVHVHILPYNIP